MRKIYLSASRKKNIKNYLFWIFIIGAILFILISFLIIRKNMADEIIESSEEHSATVIFLHGLGDIASNWQNNLRPIARNYPHIKFIIPQAPWRFVSMIFYLPMPAWYNIKGNIKDIMNLKQNKQELLESVKRIEKIIQEEINNKIEPGKIIVAGHSQGGSVALVLGLITNYSLSKIVILSGFVPCREDIPSLAREENKIIPFSFYHKKGDDSVPFEAGLWSFESLKEKGYNSKLEIVKEVNTVGNHFYDSNQLKMIFKKELRFL